MHNRHSDFHSSARRREQGFTLLEAVVALAIAALGMTALLAAAGSGVGQTGLAEQYIEASRRAQSRLALVGPVVPLAAGEVGGDDGGGFAWRIRIAPPVTHARQRAGMPAPSLYTVEVTITWSNGGMPRQVSLQSQRLGSAGASGG